jgi:thioesterase domain-containing protein
MNRLVNVCVIASTLFAATSLGTMPAVAAGSGAMVEEIDSAVSGVGVLDTLKPGQRIDLRPDRHAVVSYLDSCVRETIAGGVVKIGQSQSDVDGGTVQRETLDCGVKPLVLTNTTQDQSATTVFRPLFDNLVKQVVADTRPVILAEHATSLELKEMGKEDAPTNLALHNGKLDLRQAGIQLRPGAIYKLTAGGRETYIKIAPDAQDNGPLLMRLVKL